MNKIMCQVNYSHLTLNGNLAQLLVKHINVLLTPKKQAKFIWPSVVLLCIKMQHVYLCNKVVNNQIPSPRLGVSLF